MQLEKSEGLSCLLQVYTQETTFGDKKYDYCSLKLMFQRHLEQKIKDSHFKPRNRDEDRLALGALNGRKTKIMSKTTPKEKSVSVGSQKADVHWEKHAYSSMTRTRTSEERDDLVHLVRQVHQNLLVKVRQGKRTGYLV